MIAETPNQRTSYRNRQVSSNKASAQSVQTLDVPGALWRYRWAVILPSLFFGVVGFLVYLQLEETYRSSTRLMVESNRPPTFDAVTGEVLGGVADIEVLQAQLYSDRVVGMAFEQPVMQPYKKLYDNNLEQFAKAVQLTLVLEPEVTDVKTAQSLITLLHFDSTIPEHCEAATRAFSKSLQAYYNERHQSTQAQLTHLLNVAIGTLSPKLSKLERQYNEFRRDAPLDWNSEGQAINPHRERHLTLVEDRSKQYQQLRAQQTTLAQMESVAEQSDDPRIVLNVMSQLLGVRVTSVGEKRDPDPLVGDSALAALDVQKTLLPLMVERNMNAKEFGESHPTVKAFDEQLETTREELLKLVEQQSERITKLREKWYESMYGDPIARAKETVDAILYSHKAMVKMQEMHIKQLDEQIVAEKLEASKLAQYEQQNEQLVREIEQNRDLLRQLEENMRRAQLSDEDSVTQVVELWKPTKAFLVGPSLLKTVGLGSVLGLLLGSGLAILLEKNANTFRDPDEISATLGVAILTHIPYFRGKRRKLKKGELDPYKSLSTDLAVVHQPASMTAEAIRSLRTATFFDMSNFERGRIIQVTSPLPGDGKSTIASNLACSIAQSGKRVLVIDCDLRRPQLTDNFACEDKLGLSNVLDGECDPLDAAHATPLPKLHVMPSGPIPSNPAEALTLPMMNELLEYLREQFDYIILDTPPLLVVTDPSITASMADAVILTLRIRRKSKPNAREALNILNGVGANVLGVVINNSSEAAGADGYSGYSYYRYGRQGGQYYRRNGQTDGKNVTVTNDRTIKKPESSKSNGFASVISSGNGASTTTLPKTKQIELSTESRDDLGQ
ncbi:polysaccharide biosynthesis tyrosine autokinase [Roseiconus lacunae]|uniref:polysaccharide biosynthesis tyrosine autokinase n=1 Tax=Roseiconus lacunae TaxID=2605694 RepID=UPI0011F24B6B|nr:tyrosine-protein kinase domain-containing protein [Roseiconus lacunae]MCD0461696.1 polysaccharide biosynthesis tyrosine autokinase [Roseiconus lacunae]WRQ49525.1 polysaccharide biosynthesis tyrosine autokinase [Stieleria sp. HD01]